MATTIIPTKYDGTQRYTLRMTLGEKTFDMEFRWNARDAAWRMSLYSADGTFLGTRRLVTGSAPFFTKADSAFPYGSFFVLDTAPASNPQVTIGWEDPPGLQTLGVNKRFVLSFTDAADFL